MSAAARTNRQPRRTARPQFNGGSFALSRLSRFVVEGIPEE